MKDQDRINHVKSLVSNQPSGWREKAEFRKANRGWLKRSAEIAVRILSELRSKGISQAELARMMDVTPQQITKLVKGQENLTLETIGKIEVALNINLINIIKPSNISEQKTHAFVENVKFSETIEIGDVIVENDNVRPLHNYVASKYYE